MPKRPFFPCSLSSSVRSELIENATRYVIFYTPGITESELIALIKAVERLSPESVHISIDLSPISFKAGYWGDLSPEALLEKSQILPKATITNGLRIGILIIDDLAWIFTATAQSAEPELYEELGFNALRLDEEMTHLLLNSLMAPPDSPEVQIPIITSEAVQQVQNELGASNTLTPKHRRMLDAIRPRLKIIQFEVRGYKITQRSLRLPREIVNIIGSRDRSINERINADWKVFLDDAELELERLQNKVEKGLNDLKGRHLVRLGHYGFGLFANEQEAFSQAWKEFFETTVEPYKNAIREKISLMVTRSQDLLYKLLEERVEIGTLQIPRQRTLFPTTQEEVNNRYLTQLIKQVHWPTPDEIIEGIVIKYRSYDISEQLLSDLEFRCLLEEQFGNLDEWFEKLEKNPYKPSTHPIFNALE